MMDVRIDLVRADHPDAAWLMEAYYDELRERIGEFEPALSGSTEPDELTSPRGAFLVLYEDGRPVACSALKTVNAGVGEIKRMFVVHEARSRGHGHRLLAALEDAARRLGHRRVVLDTAEPLIEAARLYASMGYREIPRYNDNPYAIRWFAKDL